MSRRRQDLRPLLDALRFVESSNRENCPDGDCGASIGPLQISRQYHQDAWEGNPSTVWSRCRELNHAENTVVAYWLKYCPEALEKQDWETLAKIHNGGPQGPHKEKTVYYWSKVSKHLKQEGFPGKLKESPLLGLSARPKAAKQEILTRQPDKPSQTALATITNFLPSGGQRSRRTKYTEISMLKKQGSYFFSSGRNPEDLQNVPLTTQKLERKVFIQPSSSASAEKCRNKQVKRDPSHISREKTKNVLNTDIKDSAAFSHQQSSCPDARQRNKKNKQLKCRESQPDTSMECMSLRHALHLGYWKFPRSAKREKAAIVLQAYWRMHAAKVQYSKMRRAAIIIQTKWRTQKHHFQDWGKVLGPQDAEIWEGKGIPVLSDVSGVKSEVGECDSELEMLYKGCISPFQEEELLSELASLLPSEKVNITKRNTEQVEERHGNFHPQGIYHGLQPSEMKQQHVLEPSLSKDKQERKEDDSPRSSLSMSSHFKDYAELNNTEMSVSPCMEKEILAELAKLLHPTKPLRTEHIPEELRSLDVHGRASSDAFTKNSESSSLQKSFIGDGIIRKLTFNEDDIHQTEWTAMENLDKEARNEALGMNGSFFGSPEKADSLHYHCFEELESQLSSVICSHSDEVSEDEVLQFSIPLLPDASPVLASKSAKTGDFNPCRKPGHMLVASLSEWQNSLLETEMQESIQKENKKELIEVTKDSEGSESVEDGLSLCNLSQLSIEQPENPSISWSNVPPLSFTTTSEITTQKTEASSFEVQSKWTHFQNLGCQEQKLKCLASSRLIEENSIISTASSSKLARSDCLLETLDPGSSTVYVRAFFQCQSSLIEKFEVGKERISNNSESTEIEQLKKVLGVFPSTPHAGKLLIEGRECQKKVESHISSARGSCEPMKHKADESLFLLLELCMLWEEQNVDLLTRSLKYKNFYSDKQFPIHEVVQEKCVLKHDASPVIAWEIQRMQMYQRKHEDQEKAREFVKKQRDTIYTNIAAYCDLRERHQIYAKWGIRRLLTGRLKKIVYELLWIDSERYEESAELVTQYL